MTTNKYNIKIHQIVESLEKLGWYPRGNFFGTSVCYNNDNDCDFHLPMMHAGATDENAFGDLWKQQLFDEMIELCEQEECYFFKKNYVEYDEELEYGYIELVEDLKSWL